jgi:quercetin dioxygenase-like cupin family protein
MKNELTETQLEYLDAVFAAPDHHRVIFEDERVRVMELRIKPGEIVPVHTHRWASVNYVLSLSDFLSYDAYGNVKLDSRTDESEIKQGGVFCLPPFPPPHSVENIGGCELIGISVELKK